MHYGLVVHRAPPTKPLPVNNGGETHWQQKPVCDTRVFQVDRSYQDGEDNRPRLLRASGRVELSRTDMRGQGTLPHAAADRRPLARQDDGRSGASEERVRHVELRQTPQHRPVYGRLLRPSQPAPATGHGVRTVHPLASPRRTQAVPARD